MDKESTCSTGDVGSTLGSGRSPGGGHDHLLQYSCLENPTDRGDWRTVVHRVTKSQTRLSEHTHTEPASQLMHIQEDSDVASAVTSCFRLYRFYVL